jgi:hypothetical protein
MVNFEEDYRLIRTHSLPGSNHWLVRGHERSGNEHEHTATELRFGYLRLSSAMPRARMKHPAQRCDSVTSSVTDSVGLPVRHMQQHDDSPPARGPFRHIIPYAASSVLFVWSSRYLTVRSVIERILSRAGRLLLRANPVASYPTDDDERTIFS